MHRKKSNIDIVKDYLSGTRPFVQVGFTPKKVERKEGEEWVDAQGRKWVQRDGYKTQVNEQAAMIREVAQQVCSCGQNIRYGDKFDQKFFVKTGMCYDCLIKHETELRVLGVFIQYEKWKLLSNYLGFLEDMKQKIEDSIKYFQSESDTLSILCNSEGFLEKFKGMNTADLLTAAQKDLTEVTATIDKVTKDKEKAKKIYDTDLAKARKKALAAMKKK